MRRSCRCAAVVAAALAAAGAFATPDAALAQTPEPLRDGRAADPLIVRSPVLTINQDALFDRSAYGRRVQSELEAKSLALAAENRSIEAELSAEEQDLTETRATMIPEEFRTLAAAFDAKVVELRRVQDQKERELVRRPEEARQEFLRAALPALTQIVRERGAVAILDTRAVILSADLIDVTDEAIRRIDQVLGDGTAAPAPDAAPETTPGTEPQDQTPPQTPAPDTTPTPPPGQP